MCPPRSSQPPRRGFRGALNGVQKRKHEGAWVKRLGDVMDIVALKRQGLSERQIAKRLGISRPTVHKYLDDPETCERGRRPVVRESKLDPYEGNIRAWLSEDPEYKATWIYDQLWPMGYAGS